MPEIAKPVVAVVDDDPRVLESLGDLLESAGLSARTYASAKMLLSGRNLAGVDCLITDIGMPDMDGLELKRMVEKERPNLPVILITGRHDVSEFPQIEKERFFRKPFDGKALLTAIAHALNGKENLQ